MKVYLSGPMTGISQQNYPAFWDAAYSLRERGHEVLSPPELDPPEVRYKAVRDILGTETGSDQYADCIGRDITVILGGVDAVVVLPGWEKSRGAAIETFAAYRLLAVPVLIFGWEDPLEEVSAVDLDRAHLQIRG